MAGLAAARARGRNGGRPSKLTADQVRAARRLYDEREHTVEQIGSMFGVSRTSIYRALRDKPGQANQAGTGGGAGRRRRRPSAAGSRQEVGVVTGPGELVTVVLTGAVPAEADAEDAAGLVADAAVSTALEVVSAAGVEGHLPVPGSTVLRRAGGMPWLVQAVTDGNATLSGLSGTGYRLG